MDRCVEVRGATELSLGVLSRVGPGIGVLGRGECASCGRGGFGGFK